ncbi:hypothetical protein TDB9533_04425 [Thalassocella blandensis]|nr:hypothetical protein TDB9533_04425 [Thalassocella blandensis]
MEFPLTSGGNNCFPFDIENAVCPVCGANKIGLGNECAFIHGGALVLDPADKRKLIHSDKIHGFLFFDWNGLEGQTVDFELAVDVENGQYTFNFCSTKCMRAFLNKCVDQLEEKIEETKNP